MDNLLTRQENRRYKLVEILSESVGWVVLDLLAQKLECSSRVLIDDILYLNNHYQDFNIRTSNQGVCIDYEDNQGLKTFSQKVLDNSNAYKLLEAVFLNPNQTVQDIADTLYVSTATAYRLIDQINEHLLTRHQFYIDTNPCRLIGDEAKLRYYFYIYFFEKYSHFDLPFIDLQKGNIEVFLKLLLRDFPFEIDFAFYNVLRLVVLVNMKRYRYNFIIPVDNEKLSPPRLSESFDDYSQLFKPYEDALGLKINQEFIEQVFTPYIEYGMSKSYESFITKVQTHPEWSRQYQYLESFLEGLCSKYGLTLPNKEALLFGFFNVVHLEYKDPQSNYILYKRNQIFTNDIKNEFPNFYQDLKEGITDYREMINRPVTEEGVAFFIYNIFATWKNLVPQMRKKLKKIKTLVISDRHQAHAEMIKDFLAYEFSEQVTVDFSKELDLNPTALEQLEYDLIVTTFTIPNLKMKNNIYIPNVPKYTDYQNIQRKIDDIIMDRIRLN